MLNVLQQHRNDLIRALDSHRYERMSDGGIRLSNGGEFHGAFRTWINGADEQIDPNVMAFAGLDDILKVYFAQSAQRTAFYVAPFSQNTDPAQTLTAATFTGTQVEFINYDESARPTWAKDAEATQSIANAATPARFTISTGGGTVWGAALITASAKSATSGLLVCCAKFAAARVLLAADKLDLEYAITASDGSP